MQDIYRGKWICAPALSRDAVPLFQKTFQAQPGTRGTLTITSLGIYEAYLNGHRIGDYIFAPGWTSYTNRLQVQTYDLTPLLLEENTLTVSVAQGWFCQDFGYLADTPLCLKCDIALSEEGIVRHIPSDESFLWAESAHRYAHMYHGEEVDLNREVAAFTPAAIFDWPDTALIPQEGEIIREQESFKPISCTMAPNGEWVLDFGQNMTGYVNFIVSAKGGEKVCIRHAEVLDGNGNIYTDNLRSAKAQLCVTLKKGHNALSRHLCFYGFRYIALSGWPEANPDPDHFTAVAVHSDMQRAGHFTCGVKDINQLYHNILWGQKGNYLDVPTDCPQRDERLGWTGDAQVFIRAGAYNYNVKKFFTKWLRDVAADQWPSGGIPHTVPDSARSTPLEERDSSSAWADAACICPWQLYETYGDKELLREHFPMMQKWVDYIRAQGDREEVWNTCFHFGDWLGLDAEEGSYTGKTDWFLIAQAMYANSLRLLIKAGKVLGANMTAYEALYPKVVQAFRELYIRDGALLCRTQTAHVLTLYFDLCEEKDRKALADTLAKIIHEYDDHLTTGFVGTPYLLHVLSREGYTALAYKLLLNRTFPSWLFSVRMGATTMWEHWDSLREDGSMWSRDMNSFNHYAYGAVGDWLFGVCAGIHPALPGYEKVLFTPHADARLGYAKAIYQTPRGTVESAWQHLGETVRYTFVSPAPDMASAMIGTETIPLPMGKTVLYRPAPC